MGDLFNEPTEKLLQSIENCIDDSLDHTIKAHLKKGIGKVRALGFEISGVFIIALRHHVTEVEYYNITHKHKAKLKEALSGFDYVISYITESTITKELPRATTKTFHDIPLTYTSFTALSNKG